MKSMCSRRYSINKVVIDFLLTESLHFREATVWCLGHYLKESQKYNKLYQVLYSLYIEFNLIILPHITCSVGVECCWTLTVSGMSYLTPGIFGRTEVCVSSHVVTISLLVYSTVIQTHKTVRMVLYIFHKFLNIPLCSFFLLHNYVRIY